MLMLKHTIALVILSFLVGCGTLSPTKVFEQEEVSNPSLKYSVYVDARPYVEYTLGHLKNAIPLSWEEFAQTSGKYKGFYKKDFQATLNKLSRRNLRPDSKVALMYNPSSDPILSYRVGFSLLLAGYTDVTLVVESTVQGLRDRNPSYILSHQLVYPKRNSDLLVDSKKVSKKEIIELGESDKKMILEERTLNLWLTQNQKPIYYLKSKNSHLSSALAFKLIQKGLKAKVVQ